MRRFVLFVEDSAHQQFLDALVRRVARKEGIEAELSWRNTRRGHGAVVRELREFLRELPRDPQGLPDLLIVATDANCAGFRKRQREVAEPLSALEVPAVVAVPDPHIERWYLVDSAAFKAVFGQGCNAPDLKCERGRYKAALIQAVRAAGLNPPLGGIEFAEDLVEAMDLHRAARADRALGDFLDNLRRAVRARGR